MSKLWRLATVAVLASAWSVNASAYSLSSDIACDNASAVLDPVYTACVGAYVLGVGESDVTDGSAGDIVTDLLNPGDVFGSADWTFLGKQSAVEESDYFEVSGIGSAEGEIEFEAFAFDAAFGPDFLTDYDIAVSFNAGDNFSVYYWAAPFDEERIEWNTGGVALSVGGDPVALSQASVYYRKVSAPDSLLPEPAVLGLLGFGLAGIGVIKRRQRR